MRLQITIFFYLLMILVSIFSINAYRLDTFSREKDLDVSNELNDPDLIRRLQVLLAAAAAAKKGYNPDNLSGHLHRRRFAMPYHPDFIGFK